MNTVQDELMHYGVLGMKWGVRRYQNKDGTLTQKGKKRYSDVTELKSKKTGEKLYVAQRQVKHGDSERNFDVIQNGRKIIIDKKKALELFNNNTK